jgi:wyosine [tRNA(Phe)-imidazoG37] synthetase (radical SAM superfamily)
MQIHRRTFHKPKEILNAVRDKVKKTTASAQSIDYLTFVADGEPTLDVHLGQTIDALKAFGIKIAVITNASLMWREDVREDLMKTDWVSLKIDALRNEIWRKINRPYANLQLEMILDGVIMFAEVFRGELVTETMLVEGINDNDEYVLEIAELLARLGPSRVYLSIPTRPPAEKWIQPPSEEIINRAYHVMHEKIDKVEYLISYEGNTFAYTGNVEEDLLSITSVHPMREEAVNEFLAEAGCDWSLIKRMIERQCLMEVNYKGRKFYLRKVHN